MDRKPEQDLPTIADIESDLERALESLRELDQRGRLPQELRPLLYISPPDGASVHVSLRQRENSHQIRRASFAHHWTPRNSGAWIVFEVPQSGLADHGERSVESSEGSGDPLQDFILALDQAEHEPHLNFVSLKWFRDTYLQKRGHAWAYDPDITRRLIQEVTERDLVRTSKVPNPKAPSFPVTSIHLNRAHPDIQLRLSEAAAKSAGEPDGGSQPNQTRAMNQ